MQLFPNGVKGLSDSKWAGVVGSAFRLVGLDLHSKPGIIRVAQKLTKHSGTTIDELCKVSINVSDGSKLWFSSESGKIWRESSGTYTLVHTTTAASGEVKCLGAYEFEGWIYWATELYLHKIPTANIGGSWSGIATQNFGAFARGDNESHPMVKQNNTLFIGDNTVIAKVDPADLTVSDDLTTTIGSSGWFLTLGILLNPATKGLFPVLGNYTRSFSPSASSITISNFVVGNTSNRVLYVWLFSGSTIGEATGCTFGGVAMTKIIDGNATIGGGGGTYTLYRLVNPTASTADIVGTFGASHGDVGIYAMLWNGVDQTNPDDDETVVNDSGTAATVSLDPTIDCQIRLGFVLSDNVTHTQAAGQTTIFDVVESAITDSASYIGAPGAFTDRTEFNTKSPERIVALIPYDVDILVGTRDVSAGRVLRWDTISASWSAQDDLPAGGVKAFLRDDNYVYAICGDFGDLMFYNGEKLEAYKKIPGDYSPSAKMKVNQNAVGFLLGIPVIGVSNNTGNPALEGVYSFGSYSKDYSKILDLTYPISSGEFTGMEIGSIIVDGADMYVSWKGAAAAGVDKLDWTAKYASAYIETVQLMPAKDRVKLKTLTEFSAQYASLPTNTNIALKYEVNYAGSFTTLTSVKDTNLMQKRATKSINKIGALRLRAEFTVSSNNAPEVEDFSYFLADTKS